MTNNLQPFFAPNGVAIIGASSNPKKLSHGILKNMISYGFSGKVYPVNPGCQRILGLNCYSHINEVPDPIDLAVIILPADIIAKSLEDCGKRDIKAVIIISGGFKELGQEGAEKEKELLEIAHKYKMRLIGPNCVGNINLYTGLNTTFIKGMPIKGGIGFVSQSGAVCGAVVDQTLNRGIGFSHFLSLGNEADVNETDVIEFLVDDDQTKVIALYVESIKEGKRFLTTCSAVTRIKPIVVLKAGQSEEGAKAVSSHTGSLAGSMDAYRTAFKQAGVIEAHNLQELIDIASAFDSQPLPKSPKVCLITNAGGPAALVSDSIAGFGLTLSTLTKNIRIQLKEKLNPAAQVNNLIDMLGGADENDYAFAVKSASQDKNVSMIVPILVPQALVNPRDIAKAIYSAQKDSNKTIICCFVGNASIREAEKFLQSNKIPMFSSPERIGPVLGALHTYADIKAKPKLKSETKNKLKKREAEKIQLIFRSGKEIGEKDTRELLRTYEIPIIKGCFCKNEEEVLRRSLEIGYPVAMKVVSNQILHKSDSGGIVLNLSNPSEVRDAFYLITKNILEKYPETDIQGVMIEKMADKGQEFIIGMKRDKNFGPMILFGLGGIYVELIKDTAFRIAPLNINDIDEMISETLAHKLIEGFRSGKPLDSQALKSVIHKMSQISIDFPNIIEMEINPFILYERGRGGVAVDCRMILE